MTREQAINEALVLLTVALSILPAKAVKRRNPAVEVDPDEDTDIVRRPLQVKKRATG